MKTLGEVASFINEVQQIAKLFGAEGEGWKEFNRRRVELGDLIAKELGLNSADDLATVPLETELGQESSVKAREFKEWFEKAR